MEYLTREQLIQNMHERLTAACQPVHLNIIDDSAQHIGHSGHGGAGHFTVEIVSDAFTDLSLVKRHQLVYRALGSYVGNEIHAVCIFAQTPAEIK